MKKCSIILLAMLLVLLTFCAAAEQEVQEYISGDYSYIIQEDGTACITKYSGKDKDLTIPDTLDGISVTSIGDDTFSSFFSLTVITIPDSVSSIGSNPFRNCEKLSTVNVSIDHPAFATIDGVLFSKADKRLVCYPCADSRTSYEIPRGVQIIGDNAFHSCKNLTTVTIPDSVTTIRNGAFLSCSSLTTVTIPDSVTTIGSNPFRYCDKLSTINVSIDHPALATIDGVLFSKTDKRLVWYPMTDSRTSYEIPRGIRIIGDYAFSNCYSLTEVSIPESVTTIGGSAFSFCTNLTTALIPDSATAIGERVF